MLQIVHGVFVCDPAVFAEVCTQAMKHLPTVPWYTCRAHGFWTLVLKTAGGEARSPCPPDGAWLHPTVRQAYLQLDFSTTLYSVKFLVTPSHLLHKKCLAKRPFYISGHLDLFCHKIYLYPKGRFYPFLEKITWGNFWCFYQSPKPLRPVKGRLSFLLPNEWNFPLSTMPMLAWTLAFVNKNTFPQITLILKAGVWVQFLL